MKEIFVYRELLTVKNISTPELKLVKILVKKLHNKEIYKFSKKIFHFNDENMGSFGFVYNDYEYCGGGSHVSDICFYDADGILCIATMYIYDNNLIDSIDIWKVDFSKLIQIPTKDECFFELPKQ
ncbi:hypothetical protein LMG7974_01906 [Campylobacter majalis]|uniref:DUF6984 domain-containing protein n=1 Tax=Campylobacter majalis TaxID=2790656 RepID=A0ABM8QA59_9BACT|nr:hypothetical protein [Campylobacter majalis]CAD7289823.1 hypothetical protein LMG7974_01906 [Campylobacter majalis]